MLVNEERFFSLTLLHSEQPKLYGVLAVLSAVGLNFIAITLCIKTLFQDYYFFYDIGLTVFSRIFYFVKLSIKQR